MTPLRACPAAHAPAKDSASGGWIRMYETHFGFRERPFRPTPDTTWPVTPTVNRLAYDFDSVDLQGTTSHSIAVYLTRGRVLMGVYFSSPDGPQPPVQGHTTVDSIVQLFEKRLAALPSSVVNRHA